MNKGQKNALDLHTKIRVINDAESGWSSRTLANKYKCGRTQIQRIIQNKNKLKEMWLHKRKRDTFQPFKDINKLTFSWYSVAKANGMAISRPILLEKAQYFAQVSKTDNFRASSGWLSRFCARHKVHFQKKDNYIINDDVVLDWVSILPTVLASYNLKNVYNCDELILYYRDLPSKSISRKYCNKMTVMLCVNALGEKEKLVVVNTIEPNVDFAKLKIDWYTSDDSLMTSRIFTKWLTDFNRKLQEENRQVLLLLDDAEYHPTDLNLSNINLFFISKNTSMIFQPIEKSISQIFKLFYMKHLLRTLVTNMDNVDNIEDTLKTIDLSDIVEYISNSWKNITKFVITESFNKCGIGRYNSEDIDDNSVEKLIEYVNKLMQCSGLIIDENLQNDIPDDSRLFNEIKERDLSFPLEMSLPTVIGLKNLSRQLGNQKMITLIKEFQKVLEDEILQRKLEENVEIIETS